MEREEFDNIVKLGERAYKATLEAKAAHKEYADAASAAYAKKAILEAKKAYEDCVTAPNFKQALIERMNRDFKTSYSEGRADVFVADPVVPPVIESHEEDLVEEAAEPERLKAGTPNEPAQKTTSEFAIQYEPEENDRHVWQSRT